MMPARRHLAFSLLETLVVLAISSIIIAVMLSIISSSWKTQRVQEAVSLTQADARRPVDQIVQYGREAVSVVPSVVLQGTTYTSTATTVVLNLNAIDASNNVITGTDYVIYRLNPTSTNHIQRLVFANASSSRANLAAPVSFSQYTTALAFNYYDAQSAEIIPGAGDLATSTYLKITTTSSQNVDSQLITRSFTDQVYLRNKQ